jgi:ligand-binding sensor domain-containing protein
MAFLSLIQFNTLKTNAQGLAIGDWRIHLPYNDVESLAETTDKIFVASEKGLYSYNMNNGEIDYYSRVNGFSDLEPRILRYYAPGRLLIIAYQNTNIDILKDGTVINISDIFRKTILGIKEINDINIYGNLAYLSCSFGVVVLDLDRFEIKESFLNLGGVNLSINSTARYNDTLFLASSEGGIYFAPANDPRVNLSDFNEWKIFRSAKQSGKMMVFNNRLYAVVDSVLQYYQAGSWNYFRGNQSRRTVSMEINHEVLVVGQQGGIILEYINGNQDSIPEKLIKYAILGKDQQIWTGGNASGLMSINKSNLKYGFLKPNGPASSTSHTMAFSGKEMWVTSGGTTPTWAPTFNNGGYYRFLGDRWVNRPTHPVISSMYDFTAIAINSGGSEVWLGTHGTGLLQLKDGVYVNRYDDSNSTLQKGPGDFNYVLGLGIDSKNDLWVANYWAAKALSVRFSSGKWKSFKLPTEKVGEMVIDKYDQKWMIVPRESNYGLCVFKEDDPEGNTFQALLYDKNIGTGNLPSNVVNAIALDDDGELWIGTEEGLAIIYNTGNAFNRNESGDAQRIIIDDGKDVGYLLGTQFINDIAIDGANRKWVGTNNGAWLIESDGSKVLRHFTESNSPLLSNVVKSIGINDITGEVFFGTEKGIISYRGDATAGTDKHGDVRVFPNPVRENYHGVITINGLPTDATVKITDIAGRLVYEMIAEGGTAVWNGIGFNGKRPGTGIYLIFTANRNDEDSLVSKLLIVN